MSAPSIRFGTDGWRGVIAEEFTFENVRRAAAAAGRVFQRHSRTRRILIGFDRRFFSLEFAQAAALVFSEQGFEVRLSKAPLPTPAVSACVKADEAGWGVTMTASHNPFEWNGFKIKSAEGRSAPPGITAEIEGELARPDLTTVQASQKAEEVRTFDYWPAYERYLKSRLDCAALKRFKASVVFDYLHGVGAGIPERLLRGGALKIIALHEAPDPLFGGLHPEPIEPYVDELKRTVRSQRAAAGVALDGDADRLGMVDERGQYLTPHQVFPLLTLHCIEHKKWRGKIVQSVSLGALGERIAQAYNLPFEEVPVGFKHVAERMLQEDVLAGGEESGGYAIRGGLPERDGILSGLLFMEMLAIRRQSPSKLLADMEKRFGRARFKRIDFPLKAAITDKAWFAQRVTATLPDKLLNRPIRDVRPGDGVKIVLSDGAWVLLRPSGTERLLRTYAESESWETTEKLLRWAGNSVQKLLEEQSYAAHG